MGYECKKCCLVSHARGINLLYSLLLVTAELIDDAQCG